MINFILSICILWLNLTAAWSNSHHPQEFLKTIAGSNNEGEQIVQHYCASCHASKPIINVGAPRLRQVNDWDSRTQHGLKWLFIHTDEGFNAMPSRGGCFECTDEQLILAILAMLPDELKKKLQKDL